MFQNSWWAEIPKRVDLRNANLSAINSEGYALVNKEKALKDLSNEAFAGAYLATLLNSRPYVVNPALGAFMQELERRSESTESEQGGAFAIHGLTHEEMELRGKRALLNLSILRGIDHSHSSRLEDSMGSHFHNDFLWIEAPGKFLSYLTDDEIAELAALVEGGFPQMTAHKDVLVEAFDRSSTFHYANEGEPDYE
jgi:hypothetical protein